MGTSLLFIVFHGINKAGGGIGKKINSQVRAFQNIGINTSLSVLETNADNKYIGRSVDGEMIEEFKPWFGKYLNWKWRFKFKKLLEYILSHDIDVVYIRYSHFANPFFIRFLRKLRDNNVRILMEIPSYPYDDEYKNVGLSLKVIKKTEEFYRRYFYKTVDKMVSYVKVPEIFRVENIRINNGIDIESIPLKRESDNSGEIHLIAVAVVNVWHGYDRIIEGLKIFYDNHQGHKVFLHIVGDGDDPESKKYRQLVQDYDLKEYVRFYGFKSGQELNELFNKADFAIGSVGIHRIGLTHTNPIKFGEYAARGIPFLYSGIYELFEDQSFIYKVSNDESPIDIDELLEFISNNKFDPTQLRDFAKGNLTWEIQMKKIMDQVDKLRQ